MNTIIKTLPLLLLAMSHTAKAEKDILPPLIKWDGKSQEYIAAKNDPWRTDFEKSNLTATPNYQDSIAYITKLAQSESRYSLTTLGISPQGRNIMMLAASNDGNNSPESFKSNGKPTLLIQAGIHAGEIDGKDASFMLLRDISKNGRDELLNKVNILFIPILNVDGHERSGPHNRVNQRGPVNMGWRTTAQNLNLNRDYAKADTPEMQALQQMINRWQPDLYLDIHVTDGEDYQYDITYGFNGEHGYSPNISNWLANVLEPKVNKDLAAMGHRGGPLTFGIDKEFSKGLFGWTASPRYSNGWGDARHLPTILVENHSLKPYNQRVLGTYVFLESVIDVLGNKGKSLQQAITKDVNRDKSELALAYRADIKNPDSMDFYGIEYKKAVDELTGIEHIIWTGKPKLYKDLPIFWARVPKTTAKMPKTMYIPAEHTEVINRLTVQGVKITRLSEPTKIKATQFIADDYKFNNVPFEGHMTVTSNFNTNAVTKTLPAGTAVVSTDQPLATLALVLLDPRAPDSYFSWGFFNQMFQRTEYIESYAMVPLAHEMLKDPKLLKAFKQKFAATEQTKQANKDVKKAGSLAELFSGTSDEKMQWLYRQSKYYDNQHLKYPVLFSY